MSTSSRDSPCAVSAFLGAIVARRASEWLADFPASTPAGPDRGCDRLDRRYYFERACFAKGARTFSGTPAPCDTRPFSSVSVR